MKKKYTHKELELINDSLSLNHIKSTITHNEYLISLYDITDMGVYGG